jgi:hypothetical protein
MADHLLTRFELTTLINLNYQQHYIGFYWSDFEKKWDKPDDYIRSIKLTLNRFLFNDLLTKQPELKNDVDTFWEEAKKEKYLTSVFWKVFDNKIFLKNVYPLIFSYNTNYCNKQERKDFIKKMIGYDPSIMNALHEKIKTNNYIDHAHLAAYVDLLPKYLKEIKDSKEQVLENLKKTNEFTESNFVQVLNSAIKSFSHDKELYDFLKTHCSQKFETYHNLRDKFNKAEDKYFPQFKQAKKIDIFSNIQEYKYIFCIKDSILIDYFGVDKSAAAFVQRLLHESIEKYLNTNVGPDLYYSYSGKGYEINTQNFDNQSKIEFYMEKLKPCITDILSSLNENTKKGIDKEYIPKLFNSVTLKFDLEKSLEEKESYKPRKAKI